MKQGTSALYLYIAILFVAVLLISNTVGVKLIEIGPLVLSGAVFLFPLSYIFGDVLTEIYGYRGSRRIIWAGFGAMALMTISYLIVQYLPAASFRGDQDAYATILGIVPRLAIGSLVGYLVGEFANSFVLSKVKVWTNGRYLWLRAMSSTIVGQAVDTVLFISIAFAGTISGAGLVRTIISSYIIKVLLEAIFLPVTYYVIRRLKEIEGIDTFDRNISYNPFKI